MYFQSKYRNIKKTSRIRKILRGIIKSRKAVLFFVIIIIISFAIIPFRKFVNPNSILLNKTQKKSFRILIDPGHYKGSLNGTEFKKRVEYKINYLLAKEIARTLKQDNDYYIELSRDINFYTDRIIAYRDEHIKEIKEETIKALKINLSRYRSMRYWSKPVIEKWKEDRICLIAVRNYAEENFDFLLSVHFNYPGKKYVNWNYRGFALFISPKNFYYDNSKKFAEFLREELVKFHNISNCGQERRGKGIVSDNYALLGTEYRSVKIPAVIMETEYIMYDICDDPIFYGKVAEAVSEAFKNYRNYIKKNL